MLAGLFRETQPMYDSTWGWWPGDLPVVAAGQTVTASSSLQLLSVYGCVRLITDAISTMPVDTYRQTADGDKVEFTTPEWLLRPTVDLDFSSWCSQVLMSLLLDGNAYVLITRNATNAIVEMIPLDPAVIDVRRVNGRKTFVYNGHVFPGEILHVKGMMRPGADKGLSPIEAARQGIGLGLAAQQYGANYFGRGEGDMPGVIESPKPIIPSKMKEIAQLWQSKRAKGGRGLPGVLDDGMTWKPTGVTNEQAQFLATRQFTDAQIAGQMFLVDPSDLGIPVNGTSLTYANLSERNTRRVQVTLLPWMIRIESALSDLLFRPRYMKFNADSLLRGDQQQRWATYQIASNINAQAAGYNQPPVMLTSEMREFEDMNNDIENPAPAPETPVEVPS